MSADFNSVFYNRTPEYLNANTILTDVRLLTLQAFRSDAARVGSMTMRMVDPSYSVADFIADLAWMQRIEVRRRCVPNHLRLCQGVLNLLIAELYRDPKTTLAVCVLAAVEGHARGLDELAENDSASA